MPSQSEEILRHSRRIFLVLIITSVAVLGCSQREDSFDRKPTVKATGTILSKGEPATGALVTFSRADGPDSEFPGAQGIVDEQGAYELTTYETKDGVIAGEYKISILWPSRADWWNSEEEPDSLDKLKGKYSPNKTDIRRTVQENDESIEAIELK